MGEHYSQIDFSERRRIQDMHDAKMPVTAIAEALGRHRSTIHMISLPVQDHFAHNPVGRRILQPDRVHKATAHRP